MTCIFMECLPVDVLTSSLILRIISGTGNLAMVSQTASQYGHALQTLPFVDINGRSSSH
eukprot:m.38120 g.38120  ORF g.38120 m.38120 type:complete len:59 (+) comp32526_c0_seq6:2144-2320(+)